MTIEAKLQRIANVLSITGLIAGLLFTAALAVASAREQYIYSQARAQMVAEGCPVTVEDEHRDVLPAVEIVWPNRWLVILGERPPAAGRWRPYRMGAYVVSADRQVTKVEILEAARAAARDRTPTDLARWRPTADIEVIDCIMEGQEIVRVRYETALSTRLLGWWVRQGARLGLRSWMNLFPISQSVFVAGNLISALMLTVIAAVLPRWMFYFVRRIVRRFAATDASV
jgi:hypothetical protein